MFINSEFLLLAQSRPLVFSRVLRGFQATNIDELER